MSMNWNVTLSQMFAVSVFGENSRAPFAPTMTTWDVPEELEEDADVVKDGEVEVAAAASVVYVVVCAAPFTVTVAVTVMTLAEETGWVEMAATEVEVEEALAEPIALFLKVSKLLPGLIAKTMPCWQ